MRKHIKTLGIMLLSLLLLLPQNPLPTKAAADSYKDAIVYYKTCDDEEYHCDFTNEAFYYGTRSKAASTINMKRFKTIAWRITITDGKGNSLFIDVKEDGAYLDNIHATYDASKTYFYDLFSISYANVSKIMQYKDSAMWNEINKSDRVWFSFQAFITYIPSGTTTPVSDVESGDGTGTLTFTRPDATYCLATAEGMAGAKKHFPGATFKEYTEIEKRLDNARLHVQYDLNGGTVTTDWKDDGYGQSGDTLTYKGVPYEDESGSFGMVPILPSSIVELPGYRLAPGNEWINPSKVGAYLQAGTDVFARDIHSGLSITDQTVVLKANWEEISYYIYYKPNGGDGAEQSVTVKYNEDHTIRPGNSKVGYDFIGWNTEEDGSGTWYQPNDVVQRLRSTHNASITLYAQYQHKTFEITVDKGGGTGGTDKFYQQYEQNFTSDKAGNTAIGITANPLVVPQRTGYTLAGFYQSAQSRAKLIANASGLIVVPSTTFLADSTIHCQWDPNQYPITFDKTGGIGGSDSTTATYDAPLPTGLEPPAWANNAQKFLGYYTADGTQYYNEYMGSVIDKYTLTSGVTLYARWQDDILPTGDILAPESWSNAADGKGPPSVFIDRRRTQNKNQKCKYFVKNAFYSQKFTFYLQNFKRKLYLTGIEF